MDSFSDKPVTNIQRLSPFGNAHAFSVKCKDYIAAIISILFGVCSPTTVVFSIVAIIVDSVKSCVFWFDSHVRKEVFKGAVPIMRNFYSTFSIKRIQVGFGIVTSVSHTKPYLVLRCSGFTVRCKVMYNLFSHASFLISRIVRGGLLSTDRTRMITQAL